MKLIYFIILSVLLGCVSETKKTFPVEFHDYKSCALIDSDFSLDDVRAIALLLPQYNYTLLVATEGAARTPYGVKIGETILQTFLQKYSGDIYEGKSKGYSSDDLKKTRDVSETLNGYLPARIPTLQSKKITDTDFKLQIESCKNLSVFIFGPYTSFHSYKKYLEDKNLKIYSYGTFPHPKNKNLGWNCEYDLNSCYGVLPFVKKMNFNFIKFSPKYSYYLTSKEMISMNESVVEKWLRAVHEVNPESWENPANQMWSDAVALYTVDSSKYLVKGRQAYPKMNPELFRQFWISSAHSILKN